MSIPSTTLGAAAIAALLTLYSPAAPVAVNDNYTTPEDTAVGSGPGELFSAGFDGSSAITFSLPAAWQIIDLKTTAAGGTNLYPEDAQARSWKTAGFDSATSSIPGWRSGTLPVQAGGISHANFTNVPATLTGLVAGGPNTVNTYLVRNTFSMNAAQAAHPNWEFSILADDGCVIYVNGVERGRLNFPAGTPLEPDGLNGGGTGDESNYTTLSADLTGLLVAGTNVIALELHQNTTSSTDAGIDFTMSPATLVPPPASRRWMTPFSEPPEPTFPPRPTRRRADSMEPAH